MRRVAWLVPLAVVVAALGVASAHAAGTGTTTSTTTTSTTTTTTTTTESFAPLSYSALPASCVGAGSVALVLPSQRVITYGTPAANLGPSAGSAVSFDSSAVSGSTCRSAGVTLSSVSLFDGAVTASSVQARDGRGTVTGLAIGGAAVSAAAGETVSVDGWGQLTLGATVGRVTAPLVLRLLQTHDRLPAGTAVVVAFAASARPVAKGPTQATGSSAPQADKASDSRKHGPQAHKTPDFGAPQNPFIASGLPADARDNPIVRIAMKYLGVRYQWGGATPATGFDCSGLVKYVFGKLGVSLPHFAASQYYSPYAVWVSPKRLQPGDLVFFVGSDGTRKEPGHVGIYIDDGYIIDAPHTGAVVRIDSLSDPRLANQYVGAKKITAQLVDARELSGVGQTVTTGGGLFPYPSVNGIEPVSESLGIAAVLPVGPRGPWWARVVFGAAIVLLLGAGLFLHRRALAADL